ncbi:MAG TPA: hypothetical protein VFJ15_01325 [Oleiagrimonas sp.]|nr:hypothetical protein [Oleiagrimonas sp.]
MWLEVPVASGKWLIWLCGVHSLGFAVFHIGFWQWFDWPVALQRTNVPTRAVTQILNLRLIYVFFGVAVVCFWLPLELLHTRLGHVFLAGMALFWVGRLVEQFVFLRINRPVVHVLSALFAAGAILFAAPLFAL